MKPTELRIGNYIDYECTTHIVNSIHQDLCTSYWIKDINKEDLYQSYYYEIKPIFLTEEWLLKFGIEINVIEGFGCKIPLPENRLKFIMPRWIEHKFLQPENKLTNPFLRFDSIHTDIYYVHQLQNLYFAIIGQELEIK